MQAIQFLKMAEGLPNPVFAINDVTLILGKPVEYARLYVHRLRHRNLLYEVEKGKYSLIDDAFEIGSHILFPSYISFLSAYYIHKLTTQIPIVVQVVSTKSKKPIEIGNARIEFIRFKSLYGYNKVNFGNSFIFLAEPEKAIIDSLYLPRHCSISETYEALKNSTINKEKIVDYAQRMSSIVVLKRLGYLLELIGIVIHLRVKKYLNNRYDFLNPYMKKQEKKSAKWKLIISEELDD